MKLPFFILGYVICLIIDIHTIAAVKTKKDYVSVSVCLKDCFDTINKFNKSKSIQSGVMIIRFVDA